MPDLTRKISQFEEEIKTVSKDRKENEYLLKGHLGKMISQLDEELSPLKREHLPPSFRKHSRRNTCERPKGRGNLREDLEQFVFNSVQETFTTWRQDLTGKISFTFCSRMTRWVSNWCSWR